MIILLVFNRNVCHVVKHIFATCLYIGLLCSVLSGREGLEPGMFCNYSAKTLVSLKKC